MAARKVHRLLLGQAPDINCIEYHNLSTIFRIPSHVSASLALAVRVIDECSPVIVFADFDSARILRRRVTVTSSPN